MAMLMEVLPLSPETMSSRHVVAIHSVALLLDSQIVRSTAGRRDSEL